MAVEDFRDGFWRAVFTRVDAHVARSDLPSDFVNRLETALGTFYENNAAAIEGARGVPGVDAPVAYQAGLEFGTLLMRQRATTDVADWGAQLAGRMVTVARNRPRLRIRRAADGAVIAEELGG